MEMPAPAGGSIELRALKTTHEYKILAAIQQTSAGGTTEGILSLFESDGTISATREIRVNGNAVRLFHIDIHSNGDIIAGGKLEDGSNRSFILRCKPDFSVQWAQTFDHPSAPENTLVWGRDEGDDFYLAVRHSGRITVINLTASGTINWKKDVEPEGLVEITGLICTSANPIELSTQVVADGASRIHLFELDRKSGNSWGSALVHKTGKAQQIHEHIYTSDRAILLHTTENTDGSWTFDRTIHYTPGSIEVRHSFELPSGFISNTSTATVENAGDAMILNTPSSQKMTFIRLYNDAYSKPWKIRQYDVPPDLQVVAMASGNDAGYLIGSNTTSRDKLLFLKTDSIGTLPGCGFNDVNYPCVETVAETNPAQPLVLLNSTSANQTAIAALATKAPANTVFSCKQLFCPSLPIDLSCTPSFHKTYRSNGFLESADRAYSFENGRQIVMANKYYRSRLSRTEHIITLNLMDENGNFIKGITPSNEQVYTMNGTDGQHFMLIGNSNHAAGKQYTFTLFNNNLEMQWSKSTVLGNGLFSIVSNLIRPGIQKDEEGNYYAYGIQIGIWTPSKIWIYKMDANGNKIWEKIHDVSNRIFSNCAMAITKESLVFAMDCGFPDKGVSVRLDKKTGNFIEGFVYNTEDHSTSNHPEMKYTDGHILYSGSASIACKLLLFDTTGKPVKQQLLPEYSRGQATYIGNGEMVIPLNQYTDGIRKTILKVDTSLQPLYAREYFLGNTQEVIKGISVTGSGSINEIGYSYSGQYGNTYFKKYDPSGTLGTCGYTSVQPVVIEVDPAAIPLSGVSEATVNSLAVPSDFKILGISEGQQIGSIPCSAPPVNACNSVSIQGPDKVCSVGKEYDFSALTATGCEAVVNWRPEQENVSIKRTGSNTVAVTFYKTGTFRLHASINTGCDIFSDQLDVLVQASDPSAIITAEKEMLCKTDSSMLTALPGFSSYTWSDGSHNEELKVKAPGKYYVDVVNACLATVSDTLVIGAWNELIPDLGPERDVCEKTVFNLELNGFTQYDWMLNNQPAGNNKNISFPVVSNSTLIAEVTGQEGCVLRDTLEINAMPVPALYLGNDTTICSNTTLLVSANPGFVDYNWSNGASSNEIEVKAAGTYHITATALNGCVAKDTIELLQLIPLPEINLGNDGILCAGDQKRLDAGIHTSYSWQNGSTERYFNLNTAGTFWVEASNDYGCKARDTIVVTEIRPIPSDFLPKEDSICRYESKTVSAIGNFNGYTWQDGSPQQSITIREPGNYTLTVTDRYGCAATESIKIIQRDCLEGLFVPNAFTPNSDGQNDVFRPAVHASVVAYQLNIYNRWGELVFTTNNPVNGWNGKSRALEQPQGVYIWQIKYHFTGGSPQIRKGTVMLSR